MDSKVQRFKVQAWWFWVQRSRVQGFKVKVEVEVKLSALSFELAFPATSHFIVAARPLLLF